MRARRLFAGIPVLLVLIATGCAAGDGVIRVTVTSETRIDGVALLRATASGAIANDFPQSPPLTVSNVTPHVLGLRFDKSHAGDVTVTVEAFDAQMNRLALGTGMGKVETSKTTDIGVVLRPAGPPPDMAMPDLVMPDMAAVNICVFDTDTFDNGCVFGP